MEVPYRPAGESSDAAGKEKEDANTGMWWRACLRGAPVAEQILKNLRSSINDVLIPKGSVAGIRIISTLRGDAGRCLNRPHQDTMTVVDPMRTRNGWNLWIVGLLKRNVSSSTVSFSPTPAEAGGKAKPPSYVHV